MYANAWFVDARTPEDFAKAAGASIITPNALEENNFEIIMKNARAHLDAIEAALGMPGI